MQPADGLENEQLVWEMLYNPAYSMPTSEAEAAWHRAMGAEMTADTDVRIKARINFAASTPAVLTSVQSDMHLTPGLFSTYEDVGRVLLLHPGIRVT